MVTYLCEMLVNCQSRPRFQCQAMTKLSGLPKNSKMYGKKLLQSFNTLLIVVSLDYHSIFVRSLPLIQYDTIQQSVNNNLHDGGFHWD